MILHGKDIILLADGVAIAAAKSCELNISADIIKTSSPSDGAWETSIAGRKSWNASCSQLVTSITNGLEMVGTVVTLRMQVRGMVGLPFSGTASDVTITSGTAPGITAITWDTTNKRFIAVYVNGQTTRFYTSWNATSHWGSSADYNEAPAGTQFYNEIGGANDVYIKTATDLILEALQGNAIVKGWKCTATVGNLAQGSFQFQGAGALTNPTT
jgi:hypothetical protein